MTSLDVFRSGFSARRIRIGVSERKEKENIYSASELAQIEVCIVYSKDSKGAN